MLGWSNRFTCLFEDPLPVFSEAMLARCPRVWFIVFAIVVAIRVPPAAAQMGLQVRFDGTRVNTELAAGGGPQPFVRQPICAVPTMNEQPAGQGLGVTFEEVPDGAPKLRFSESTVQTNARGQALVEMEGTGIVGQATLKVTWTAGMMPVSTTRTVDLILDDCQPDVDDPTNTVMPHCYPMWHSVAFCIKVWTRH